MISLWLDFEALARGFVYLEATNGTDYAEEPTEKFENEFGFFEIEVSPKGELLFLNHPLMDRERKLLWLIDVLKGV